MYHISKFELMCNHTLTETRVIHKSGSPCSLITTLYLHSQNRRNTLACNQEILTRSGKHETRYLCMQAHTQMHEDKQCIPPHSHTPPGDKNSLPDTSVKQGRRWLCSTVCRSGRSTLGRNQHLEIHTLLILA